MCIQAGKWLQEHDGNKDLAPQLVNAPDILKCLYEFFHRMLLNFSDMP